MSLKLALPLRYPSHIILHSTPIDALDFHTGLLWPHIHLTCPIPPHLPNNFYSTSSAPGILCSKPLVFPHFLRNWAQPLQASMLSPDFLTWCLLTPACHKAWGKCSSHSPQIVLYIAQSPSHVFLNSTLSICAIRTTPKIKTYLVQEVFPGSGFFFLASLTYLDAVVNIYCTLLLAKGLCAFIL